MAEIYLVASGKGGVGKSSFTVGIAKALTCQGNKVLVIDADVGLRSLDLLISGAEAVVYDWGDVIGGKCEPMTAVVQCEDIWLLTCPLTLEKEYTADAFKKLIANYSNSQYDYIIIDAPAGIGTVLKMACAAAKKGIVISTPDSVCVRSACITARVMQENGIHQTRLVINRFCQRAVEKKKLLNIDCVIDSTEIQLLGVIPEDSEIGYGRIFRKRQFSTPSFKRIAGRMDGESIALFE